MKKLSKLWWKPHSGQRRAIEKGVLGSLGLFFEPGVGKTSTILEIFKRLKNQDKASKLLIVAPVMTCYLVWPLEIRKWRNFNHLTYTVLHGPMKEVHLRKDRDIYIINREGLPWLMKHKPKQLPVWDVLVIDESTKFKSFTSQQYRVLKRYLHLFKYRYIAGTGFYTY